ncbi:Dolichyl-phosphate-mannose-protein mannosyltransferase [uncultured archaeon]|nr:Dolichyl-phosphate-mannose-protein mannosyltransferase [uncultured archaeon]
MEKRNGIKIHHFFLVSILLLSLAIQSYRLEWGLVSENMGLSEIGAFHIVEAIIVNIPLNMMMTGDLNPHHFLEPSLFYNSMFVVFTVMSKTTAIHSLTQYFYIARVMSLLFSTGVVLLVYLIGKEAGGTTVGLYSALLMALNPYYLWFSSIAKEDPMMIFLVMLSMYLFARHLSGKNSIFFLLSMAAAGFAASTKFPAGMMLPILLLLYFLHGRTIPLRERLKNSGLSLGAYIIAFVAGTPYSVISFTEFSSGALGELRHYMTDHPGFLHFTWFVHVQTLTGLWDAANIWGKNGYGLSLILVMAGFYFIALRIRQDIDSRERYLWYMLVGWIMLSVLVFFFLIKIKMGNQMMIMTPAAMVVAGFGFKRLLEKLPSLPARVAAGGVILILIFTYAASGIVSSQNDNRYYAAEWLEANADRNASIGMTFFVYVPPEFTEKSILTPDLSILENSSYEYILLSSWEYQRYLESPETYPVESEFYSSVLQGKTHYKPVAQFVRTENSRERTLNFGLRALAERDRYRGEVDIYIFRRSNEYIQAPNI